MDIDFSKELSLTIRYHGDNKIEVEISDNETYNCVSISGSLDNPYDFKDRLGDELIEWGEILKEQYKDFKKFEEEPDR